MEEADACLRAGGALDVVALVPSVISKVNNQNQIRLTWASSTLPRMVVTFMVGRAKNGEEQIIRQESELYQDIVQVSLNVPPVAFPTHSASSQSLAEVTFWLWDGLLTPYFIVPG